MSDKKYKLTISILASNRKDTIPKTLNSLKPILDNVSSELIVTDTGCDEDLLDVIRKYTDKIVKFQWCNDFSKARNVGLKMAQGEWFMFIDDDEWFEDVSEMIAFFNNDKEEQKYNSFGYVIRNYMNPDGMQWQDSELTRGIRLGEGVEFVDAIHEHYSNVKKPTKVFDAYVHHYGYAHATEEARKKHFQRNMELLNQLIDSGDREIRTYFHMVKEYSSVNDYESALRVGLEGLEHNKGNNNRLVAAVKMSIIYSFFRLERYSELCEHARGFLCFGGLSMGIVASMDMCLCFAEYNLKRYRETMNAAIEYFAIREYLEENPRQTVYDMSAINATLNKQRKVNELFVLGLHSAVLLKKREQVENILKGSKYIDDNLFIDNMDWIVELLEMMKESDDKNLYAKVLAGYMEQLSIAAKICNRLMDMREVDENMFIDLTSYIVSEESDSPQMKLLRKIYQGLKIFRQKK